MSRQKSSRSGIILVFLISPFLFTVTHSNPCNAKIEIFKKLKLYLNVTIVFSFFLIII